MMPDYRKMYKKLFKATEDAINVLVAAQQECEEMYMSAPEDELEVVTALRETQKQSAATANEMIKKMLPKSKGS